MVNKKLTNIRIVIRSLTLAIIGAVTLSGLISYRRTVSTNAIIRRPIIKEDTDDADIALPVAIAACQKMN